MDLKLKDPWLVAVWPGMGGIAQIAGSHLAHVLGAELVAEISPDGYFEVRSVKVNDGLILPRERPKSHFVGWKNPRGGPDLLLFLGEEQPLSDGYAFCNELLSVALEHGVTRVLTFAAMATPIRPDVAPRVFAAATDGELLKELQRQGVEVLREAEISGLNGVLLAAANARGIGGLCLLGEFPYFASSVANPKASAAVLRVFSALSGIPLDLTQLETQAEQVEMVLTAHLEQLERAAAMATRAGPRQEEEVTDDWPAQEELAPEIRGRIEDLFEQARQDRSKALGLKAELDRHGVFAQYEDRFLDLFKRAE